MTEPPKKSVIRGTCPHGKILFAVVNEPNLVKSCAEDIAEMVAAGFTMETVEALVTFDGGCDVCDKARTV
jgi:hypothetical protein